MDSTNDQAEDLSESNNSCTSTTSSTSASEPSFVDPYKSDQYASTRSDGPADLSVAPTKDYQRSDVYIESSSTEEPPSTSSLFRACGKDSVQKEAAMYTFCREIRQKSLHAVLERSAAVVAASSGAKDLEFMKAYGLPGVDQVKDLSFGSRMTGIGIERLRASSIHADSSASTIDPEDLKSVQHQRGNHHLEQPMGFERLRHPIFQSGDQFPHPPHHHLTHHHHAITQIQHVGNQHHQHQHQQAKSFTIDAILGLRGGAQRDKQRGHPYRKSQGQENTGKSLSASSCSNGSTNGINASSPTGSKLKRVRTIFTNEQLERLENEFARQQYMVGPERLYLAHALRLTEAQVKVWFQNRRIKWRKINHEKQSQRLHELHHHQVPERDDSSENVEW